MMKRNIILLCCALFSGALYAQNRIAENVEYNVGISGTASTGDYAPFWFSANRNGAGSIEPNSAYARASLIRNSEVDSLRRWRVGYGLDLIGGLNQPSAFNVLQAFAEVQYEKVRLSLGSKVQCQEFKNDELSSGGMTNSVNAVPIPQLRAELADWWNISGKSRLVFIKGHVSYGMLTDGWWQENNNGGKNLLYSKRSLYHSKAGYIRVGNERKFPLVGSIGLEMKTQFGGTVYNLANRGGAAATEGVDYGYGSTNKLGSGIKDFFHAFIPGGSDANDGDYSNVGGNQLGSWSVTLGWHGKDWKVQAYLDHFFEDHSMMFWQYKWRDNLIGIEAQLPRNRFVSSAVVEFLNTMDQSGPIYHDKTDQIPTGLYGKDNYYSHHIYGGYQHWGQSLGNPLLLSPVYNGNGQLGCNYSRLRACHVGVNGDPTSEIHWRVLFSHLRTLGTYDAPTPNPLHASYFLAEVAYKPHQLQGWKFQLSLGTNAGQLLGSSQGAMLTITKSGVLNRREVH